MATVPNPLPFILALVLWVVTPIVLLLLLSLTKLAQILIPILRAIAMVIAALIWASKTIMKNFWTLLRRKT